MTDTAPTPDLPDLPEPELAEVHNSRTGERELSTHGAAYYGSNWRVERWLYTADQMHTERQRTYAIGHAAGVAAERERWRQEILGSMPESRTNDYTTGAAEALDALLDTEPTPEQNP
jgi:hypothetical protein